MGGFIFDSSEPSTSSCCLSNVYAEYAFNLMCPGAVNPDDVCPHSCPLEDAASTAFVGAAQSSWLLTWANPLYRLD